jgi:hypothetical protein
MTPEEVPAELKDILDRRAGKTHSQTGTVMQALAEILTRYDELARSGSGPPPFAVEIQWHSPDAVWAAAFIRDGKAWYLDGALVGMSAVREGAVTDLIAAARHLVINGENYLTGGPILLADRDWLFEVLDQGPSDDEMYAAIRAAREEA